MKRLTILMLAVLLPLAACSAEQEAAADNAPAAAEAPASQQPATDPAEPPAPMKVAQADPQPADTHDHSSHAPALTVSAAKPGDAGANYVAGKDYRVLTPAQPTSSPPDKVEITEIFMYSCPHCFSFEPFVDELARTAPAGVSFVRIPANFHKIAKLHSQAYYAAESLGLLDQLHTPLFSEIHVRNNKLQSLDAIKAFVSSQGVDAEKFVATMNGFDVDAKVRRADTMTRRYRVQSVPLIVINGKYVTQGSMTGSVERLRGVIDYLVSKELAGG